MSKKNKTKNKKQIVRRTNQVRRSPTRPRLHDQNIAYKFSLDQTPLYVQYERTSKRRKPIEPERSDQVSSKKINFGSFHSPIDINLKPKDYICAKRQIRREIIHALGYGGRKVRKPKYNNQSKIKC
ncbi:MAG: hypothetical protein [Microviridae sp.]|nr:MAG: hypothetical protein [Microviridae sp.]